MESLGLEYLVLQITNFLILGGWLVMTLIALFGLRHSRLKGFEQALWALMIIAIPLLGALAFFIVRPGKGEL